ncbi:hypothetical protein D3C84_445950 [compost metagenome]
MLQINDPAQFLAGRGAVCDFVVAPGEGFTELVILWKIPGCALQIRDSTGAFFPGFGTGQAHAVIGAIAWIVRFAAHGFGQPRGALRQVASLLRGHRCSVEMPGIRRLLERGTLALQGERVIATGVGNGCPQCPFVGATLAALLPIAFSGRSVAGIEGAAAGGESGVVAQFSRRDAAPNGQGTGRIPGGFQCIGQRQAAAAVAEFLRMLVIHHCFTGTLRHGTSTECTVVTRA